MKAKENTNERNILRINRGLHRLLILLVIMTLILLVAGALVTSNEAGDSVPDWPLSFGRWVINSGDYPLDKEYGSLIVLLHHEAESTQTKQNSAIYLRRNEQVRNRGTVHCSP